MPSIRLDQSTGLPHVEQLLGVANTRTQREQHLASFDEIFKRAAVAPPELPPAPPADTQNRDTSEDRDDPADRRKVEDSPRSPGAQDDHKPESENHTDQIDDGKPAEHHETENHPEETNDDGQDHELKEEGADGDQQITADEDQQKKQATDVVANENLKRNIEAGENRDGEPSEEATKKANAVGGAKTHDAPQSAEQETGAIEEDTSPGQSEQDETEEATEDGTRQTHDAEQQQPDVATQKQPDGKDSPVDNNSDKQAKAQAVQADGGAESHANTTSDDQSDRHDGQRRRDKNQANRADAKDQQRQQQQVPPSNADRQSTTTQDGRAAESPTQAVSAPPVSGEIKPTGGPAGTEAEPPAIVAGKSNASAPGRAQSPNQPTPPDANGPVDRVRFVQRVARAFEAAGRDGGAIRMRLHPPELGGMRLEITVRNGQMTAQIETETTAAKNLLLDNLPALRERLAEQNIKVERFDVQTQDRPADSSPDGRYEQQQAFDQHQRGGQHQPSAGGHAHETSTPDPLASTETTGDDGRLNIVV